MFGGASEHSLDKKCRMHLPRRILSRIPPEEQKQLFLVRGLDSCIYLFAPVAWKHFSDRFTNSLPSTAEARNFLRLFFSSVAEVGVDSQGRLLVPEALRSLAGITGKVVVNGMGDYVEIWSAEKWTAITAQDAGAFEKMYQKFVNENLGGPT